MPKQLWAGRTRIYFNAWEDAPRFWSADQGLGSEEITVEAVTMDGANLTTVVNAGSKQQPRAWFEGDVCVSLAEDGRLFVEDRQDAGMDLNAHNIFVQINGVSSQPVA